MKNITFTEFRNNLKKYAELAEKEKVVVNRGKGKAFFLVPVEQVEDNGYSEEFIQSIKLAEKQIMKRQSTKVKNKEELMNFLGSLKK